LRNKLTIIISDVNGSKHYTINQIIKKILFYFILFVLVFVLIGIIWIKILLGELNNINSKKLLYKKQAKILLQKNINLSNKYKIVKDKIKQKSERLDKINDKISDLENIMGISSDVNESIGNRINNLKITSIDRKEFFKNIPNGYPVPNHGISSKFGWRINPILKKKEFHPGLDLRAKMGEKVIAPADAIVEYSGYHKRSGYGNLIILDHNFGFKTLYGHLSKRVVKNGDFVKKGEIIGYVGSTGLSTGHHLHYGVMYLQRFLNPYYFVKWNNKDFNYIFKKERKIKWQSLIKAIQSQIQLSSQQVQK